MNHRTMQSVENSKWRWLRVYSFADCKDDLIVDGIHPLLMRNPARKFFFKRDWVGGPNILLGIMESGNDFESDLQQFARELRLYLQKLPAIDLPQSEFETLNHQFALWELQPQSLTLQADNSLMLDCPEPFSPMARDPQLKEFVRDFLSGSSRLVIDWLQVVRDKESARQHIALHALIGLVWLADPERLRAHISFHSHVEGLFRGSEAGSRLRPVFERRYQREREEMNLFLRGALERLRQSGSSFPGMAGYLDLVRGSLRSLRGALEDRRYRILTVRELLTLLAVEDSTPLQNISTEQEELFARLDRSSLFRAWQITVNLVYLMMNQLGVRPLERFLACYMVTRAAEDMFGERAADLTATIIDTGDISSAITFA